MLFVAMEFAGAGFFAAAWLASAVWAVRDAGRRCGDRSLRYLSVAAAVALPLVGAALYALARPCDERIERRAQRLRIRMLESAVGEQRSGEYCVACSQEIEPDFRCCPACGETAHVECRACGELVKPSWSACPWCGEPVVVLAEHRGRHAA